MTLMMLLESTGINYREVPETEQMDKALKQRLVGASVLIILAVIILPMLLSGRSETLKQESRQIELPAKPDELSIETRRFPVGVPDKPVPEVISSEPDSSGQQQVSVQQADEAVTGTADPDETGSENVAPATPASEVEKPPAVTSITLSSGRQQDLNVSQADNVASDSPRYLVQVASFSSEKRANALADKLRADNFPVLMDVVDRTAGLLHRVRVGPYSERADADAVVASLSAEIKDLTPRVLDLRPGDSAPVSTPSDPLVRWVVQVGSLASPQGAEDLVARLRLAGLAAFSEKVTSSSGAVYKVRIGPEISRDSAVELARRVKVEHGLDGFVTTQE